MGVKEEFMGDTQHNDGKRKWQTLGREGRQQYCREKKKRKKKWIVNG